MMPPRHPGRRSSLRPLSAEELQYQSELEALHARYGSSRRGNDNGGSYPHLALGDAAEALDRACEDIGLHPQAPTLVVRVPDYLPHLQPRLPRRCCRSACLGRRRR